MDKFTAKVLFIILLLTPQLILGANILFFYALATHSHRTAIEPLSHKLAERGHNVTFLSPIKPVKPNENITEFVPQSMAEHYRQSFTGLGDTGFPDRLKDKNANWLTGLRVLQDGFVQNACETLLSSPDLKPWIQSSKFDLVIVGHPPNKCAYAFAFYWNASVITSSASSFFLSEEDTWGYPLESSWLPRYQLANVFTKDLTFYDRVYNVLNPILYHVYWRWITAPRLDGMLQDFLGLPDLPSMEKLETFLPSLVFINQHFSEDYARSLPPSVISIGGMHCTDEHGELPRDLEEFIQGAGDDGFIFISFGSMVRMSLVPEYLIEILFNAIRGLKVRFLWKWDKQPPANLPSNVLTRKWFPQQDILAHPKIKGFVSHGGLMSTQQSIFHKVPMIVIPVQFDQPFNARKVKLRGSGIHLELSELSVKNFREAVLRLVHDKVLKENMSRMSEQFRDRPMSPLDTALYWTEYVLRHGDCVHMKPLAIHQPWWQRRLLDVWLLLFISLVAFLAFIVKVTAAFARAVFMAMKKARKIKES